MSSRAVKAGMGYTIGNFLVRGIQFLAMPLFGRLMTTEEFGVYNVFASYDAILFVFVGLCVHASLRSANQQFEDRLDEYTSSISLIYLIGLGTFSLALALFGAPLSRLFGFSRLVLFLLLLHSFGSSLLSLYNDRLSISYRAGEYVGVTLANALCNVGLSLVLMLTLLRGQRDLARILGASLTMFGIGIWILLRLWRRCRPRVVRGYWHFAVCYSLPIVPHGVSTVLLSQFDRIMISRMVGDAATGIYGMAANVKLILVVIMESIANAWSTWFFERSKEGDRERIIGVAALLHAGFAFLFLGLCAIGPEVLLLLGGSKYAGGRWVLVPMLLEAYTLFLYNLVVQTEYVAKKTGSVMAGTLLAAALNVVLNTIFIARCGYVAAAWTTLFSYVCYLAFHLLVARRIAGYDVLPLRRTLPAALLVLAGAAVDLIWMDRWPVRWAVCACMVVPLGAHLWKKGRPLLNEMRS